MEGLIWSWFRTTDGTVPHVGYRPPLPESLRKVMILVNSSVFLLFWGAIVSCYCQFIRFWSYCPWEIFVCSISFHEIYDPGLRRLSTRFVSVIIGWAAPMWFENPAPTAKTLPGPQYLHSVRWRYLCPFVCILSWFPRALIGMPNPVPTCWYIVRIPCFLFPCSTIFITE